MNYFETNYVAISWDESAQCVVVQWHKFAVSEQLRQALDKIIELLKAKQGHQVLADTRNQGVISIADQDWINQDWYPRAVKAGYKSLAVVLSKNIITKMSINRIMSVEHPEIKEAYFDEVDKALVWLREQAKTVKPGQN